jgi:hypothetical protein
MSTLGWRLRGCSATELSDTAEPMPPCAPGPPTGPPSGTTPEMRRLALEARVSASAGPPSGLGASVRPGAGSGEAPPAGAAPAVG